MKTLTTGSRLLKSVVLACAAVLGLSTWAANAPTVTVNGTAVTISNESGVENWDNATLGMSGYSGKSFTIPAATDLAAGTILKVTSVSIARSTSQSYNPPKLNISGVVSDTATVTTGGFTSAGADKITYSFADVNCLVKVGTASQIRFIAAGGEDFTGNFAFRLGSNAYQFIESIVWSGKAPIIEIEAEIVEGYVAFEASSGNGWGFESGTGSGKVYLSGYKNYMKTPGSNEKEIVLVDGLYGYAFDIKDANSMSSQNQNQITDWAKISGDGTLTTATANSSRTPVLLLRDTSDFTGAINATASCKLTTVLCGTTETFESGAIYNKVFLSYCGGFYVTSERSTSNSNVVTVPAGKTWTGTALLNEGETVIDGTFAGPVVNSGNGSLTINGTVNGNLENSGGLVTINGTVTGVVKNWQHSLVATSTAGALNFGSDIRNFNNCTIDPAVEAKIVLSSEEYGNGAVSVTSATGVSSITVYAPDGTTLLGTITPDANGDGELTLPGVSVSGLACWADYEMNGNLNSTGSDTTSLTYDSGSSVDNFYNSSMLYTYRHPYRNITYPSTWTAVVRCTVPKVANGAVITFGTKDGGLIGLVAGDNPETEMKLIKTTGNSAYETLATMSIVDGTSAQHVYIFAVENNSTIKVYCDGSEVLNQTYDAFTLGGGIQVGSVHGGVGSTGITRVWKGDSYTGLTDEDLEQARIDCVRLYDYSLSAAQVAAISAEFPAVKLYRATVAADANTTWGALEWAPAWDGGNSSSKVILTASGDATVELPATLTAEEVQLVIPAASTLTLSGNDAVLAITEPLDVSGGTVELTGDVTLSSDLTISGKVKFNGFTATGADVKIASGATVTAADAMVVVALGTYTCTEGTVVDSSNNIENTVKFIPLTDAAASLTYQGETRFYSEGTDAFNAFSAAVPSDENATLTILDGTDYSAYNAQFVTLGYYYNQSEGTITKAYARISGVNAAYPSLAAAISAATDGQTVVLVRASSEAITLDKAITLTEQAAFSGTLSGTGTLTLTALRTAALTFDNWTGTVAITPAITDGSAGFRFNNYGTTGSTVSLVGGLSGSAWLANANIAPTVNLVGDFTLGGFSATFPNTISKLTGSGAFKLTADGTTNGYVDGYFLVQDVSEFTGDIQVVKPGLAIGSSKPASPTTYGQIVISQPVTVGATATWTASNGIVLADTTATLTVPSGATVPVPTTSVQYGEILTTTGSQGETIYSVVVEVQEIPVAPGTTTEPVESEAAAQADAAKTVVSVPAAVAAVLTAEQQTAYKALFEAKVVTVTVDETTKYAVAVELTDEAVAAVQTAVDAAASNFAKAAVAAAADAVNGGTATVATTAGLYYVVEAGAEVNAIAPESCTLASGSSLDLTLPNKGAKGFYRLRVSASPVAVEAE